MKIGEKIQTADWKNEKHVPVLECPDKVNPGEWLEVRVGLSKAVEHPNTTEHHIRWIRVYFSPDDDKFTYDLGTFTFNAHGEHATGANAGPVHTRDQAVFQFKTMKSGTLHAVAYCNIHGLWESSKRLTV
ncbi:class II SORL domain-containing protein [bacterium]|nr:class II SORL domain-containing protein [candidate division CSSED10-310 bacterium]